MRQALENAAKDERLLEIGRLAVEDYLVKMRDVRLSMIGCNNGLVIKEQDGSDSHVIRASTIQALKIGLIAMANVRGQRSISVSCDFYERLKRDCENKDVSIASVVESLVHEFIDKEESDQ